MPFLHIRLAKRQGVDQPLLLLQNRVLPLSGEAGFFLSFSNPLRQRAFTLSFSLSVVVIWVASLHASACLEAVRGMLVVG